MYKLLIVDDNNMQLQYLSTRKVYEKVNITTIITAHDGEEGLKLFERHLPDIVITDIAMPVMNGIEMTENAKKIKEDSQFIFVSCYEDFNYMKGALENNVGSYLLKPVDEEELLKCLKKAIENIENNKHYGEMNKFIAENINAFRENFLYRFLHSDKMDTVFLEHTLRDLKFNEYSAFMVAIVEINNCEESIYRLTNLIKEKLFSNIEGFCIMETDERCSIVFLGYDRTSLKQNVIMSLKEFSKYMSEKNFFVNIGLSIVCKNMYEIRSMMNQAISVLDNRLTDSDEGIYIFEQNTDIMEPSYEISEIRNDIMMIIDEEKKTGIEDFIEKYFNMPMSKANLKRLSISIIITLELVLIEHGMEMGDIFGGTHIVWDKIDNFETILDTKQWIYNILDAALYMCGNESKRYDKIIRDIQENINKNYASISNVSQIVDDLYISVSYAQSLFKRHTGKTITDYVTETRMKEAKKLLSDQYVKIYEVAELVGYKSKAHFSETFKKYTGFTPKEYRQRH